jgi:hypothetical protein
MFERDRKPIRTMAQRAGLECGDCSSHVQVDVGDVEYGNRLSRVRENNNR